MKISNLFLPIIAVFPLSMLLAATIGVGFAAQITETVVEIGPTGFASVSITVRYNQTEALTAIHLLGKPDTFTIKAVAADGATIPFSTTDDQIILNVVGARAPVQLQYSTQTLTSKIGRVWNVTLQLTQTAVLRLPKGAVLIGINGVPEDIARIDERFNIILSPRTWVISYFLPPTTEVAPLQPAINPLWVVGGLVPVAALVAYVALSRRKRVYTLRPDDRKILEYVSAVGGQAYESDIVRELNMPKSTVWRAIKRLSHARLVEIVREANRVKVVRK